MTQLLCLSLELSAQERKLIRRAVSSAPIALAGITPLQYHPKYRSDRIRAMWKPGRRYPCPFPECDLHIYALCEHQHEGIRNPSVPGGERYLLGKRQICVFDLIDEERSVPTECQPAGMGYLEGFRIAEVHTVTDREAVHQPGGGVAVRGMESSRYVLDIEAAARFSRRRLLSGCPPPLRPVRWLPPTASCSRSLPPGWQTGSCRHWQAVPSHFPTGAIHDPDNRGGTRKLNRRDAEGFPCASLEELQFQGLPDFHNEGARDPGSKKGFPPQAGEESPLREGRMRGIEPPTSSATNWRSTTELHPPCGACYELRRADYATGPGDCQQGWEPPLQASQPAEASSVASSAAAKPSRLRVSSPPP